MKLSNKIKKSFSLKENNLLKIDSTAKFFIEIFDFEDLKNIQNFTSTKKIFSSDYVISTTGNAVPEKYDEISKTGQVFITLITPIKSITKEYFLDGDRMENIKKTVDFSINLLHKNLSI